MWTAKYAAKSKTIDAHSKKKLLRIENICFICFKEFNWGFLHLRETIADNFRYKDYIGQIEDNCWLRLRAKNICVRFAYRFFFVKNKVVWTGPFFIRKVMS